MKKGKGFLESMDEWVKEGKPISKDLKYIEEYEKKFGDLDVTTWDMGIQEYIRKIKRCLRKNKTWEQLYGIEEYEDDEDL